MKKPFIKLENVSLEIPIIRDDKNMKSFFGSYLVGGKIFSSPKKNQVSILTLDDISCEIKYGDRIGLIGHNGSGKTTLLRTLSGIYAPTLGKVSSFGKISTLIDQSAGLEIDNTGHNNIVTCGLFLGFSKEEILKKREEISEFSGLGEFINYPVKTYSSGMLSRLTFSIATSLEPEILILDEGFGAADISFANKAARRIDKLMKKAKILVFASHDKNMLKKFCNKAYLLEKGKLLSSGNIDEVWSIYEKRIKTEE